jgi:hypothetical protein
MKTADSAMLYNTHPVVSELNRVKGFDPLRFLKATPEGPKLELKYKKIWFRLKYPQGRFKYSALKITDQLAIIEARVYFDKNDVEPKAVFTARSDKITAPGGMYIEAAQHAAIDQALTDAGFGIQFVKDSNAADTVPTEQTAVSRQADILAVTLTETKNEVTLTECQSVTASAPAEEIPKTVSVEERTVNQDTLHGGVEGSCQIMEYIETPVETIAERSAENAVEIPVDGVPIGGYTNDMSVEEICARMTLEEAENYIVPLGTCNGQTMKQVADRRPASLRYYISGYSGNNNILRAAATLVSENRSQKAS